jgi:signal transduction histidine kinase/CheY-like chemotaxis protein
LGVDATAILLFNSQMQTIEYAASRGFNSAAIQQTKLKLGEGFAGRVVFEHRTVHITDLMETSGALAKAFQWAKENFTDYYGTPLIVKGEVKGVLEIFHRSPLNPDPEWLDFLETLAGQGAIAIDSALLFRDLQRSNAELEQRVTQRTAELNQTNIELEHANRTKDEFLANMSHELRTPLNSILGMSESLLEQRRDPLSEHQQRYIQTMASSGQHLLDLINDILDLSKIEAGKFDYFPQSISVDEICRSSLAFVKSQALKKSITVNYVPDISVAKIFADPRRLKQILVNLLTNAVKFTPEKGEVILQINSDLEKDLIQFAVIDTGIGIAPEDLQKLFQPFVQIDSGLNRQQEGTGLGLALVQRLTDLHGGSVQVESEAGKGSRFTINLPCRLDFPAKSAKSETAPDKKITDPGNPTTVPTEVQAERGVILLAEDNMPNILTIGEYVESYGYRVVVAHDGLEALAKAEEVGPDLILMDIQMPAMNGLEAIAHLRANTRFAATPIIALTALAMPGDRERCLEAGANEYMSKPVSLKAMIRMIQQLLGSED